MNAHIDFSPVSLSPTWKVSRISLCQRTGGYTVTGTYLTGSKEVKVGQLWIWDLTWKYGFMKCLYQYDFSDVGYTAEAHAWAVKCGHSFPEMDTARIVK